MAVLKIPAEKLQAITYADSDRLRDEIQALGYIVEDTKDGMKIFKP